MARSFNDLIDFLLSEIALCGDQGASTSDILTFIETFYKRPSQDGMSDELDVSRRRTPVLDRPFQERVWSWLTRNPEVSVGKKREGNHLNLTEAEGHSRTGVADGSSTASEPETKPLLLSGNGPLRVFVSEERTWFAITGHEPDGSKVLPTEFALLSIIASRKSKGIVQTDLVRLSGQDKRSVPKRTDMLQQKGYIEKRPIQVKSSRTSLCMLRKFAREKPAFNTTETPAERGAAAKHEAGDIIDFKVFIDKLFEVLREYSIIARNDLKWILGLNDRWRWRILSRTLRKFERIGVLKRVKAMSQYSDTMKALHPCIMLIRDPTEKDLQLFHEDSRILFANLEQEGNVNVELDDDLEADADRRESSDVQDVGVVMKEDVEEAGRMLPSWNPDRSFYNLIFESIDSAGTTGRTNYDTIRVCFGGFFRRPLENALTRLVECWQLSQPPHLRHLALVRDLALSGTVTHYIHYSARNFRRLVESGQASWEAIEFAPKDNKSEGIDIPSIDAVPQVDEFGLPLDNPSKELLKKGDVTLLECVLAAKPADYLRSSSDPIAVMLENGSYIVRDGHQRLPAGALQRLKTPGKIHGRPKGTPNWKVSERPEETILLPRDRPMSDMDVDMDGVDGATVTAKRPPKLSKYDPERYKGMSEKEMLEAMGLDETWTEYNVLLIERRNPGVYITPRGRRRPAGRRQGRPRISQLAVFKSPKLSLFPWFAGESTVTSASHVSRPSAEETETVTAPSVPRSRPVSPPGAPAQGPEGEEATPQSISPPKNNKRSYQEGDAETVHTHIDTDAVKPPKRKRGRPPKKPRLEEAVETDTQPVVTSADGLPERTETTESKAEEQQPVLEPERVTGRASRKRGRPPKYAKQGASINQEAVKKKADDAYIATELDEHLLSSSEVESPQPNKRPRVSQISEMSAPTSKTTQMTEDQPMDASQEEMHAVDGGRLEDTVSLADGEKFGTAEEREADSGSLEPETQPLTKVESAIENGPLPPSTPDQSSSMGIRPVTEEPANVGGGEVVQETEGKRVRVKKTRVDRGGSVAVFRRKIVMDIVEKAGGAFPLGTELWYPFTTAWQKTKYTEKPDLRTIRTTVKHMVDSGKLRQLTFSGRDGKGVMVTKSIITKPDVSPDDPLVKDMQQKMLSAGSRFYFPPNIEINPDLTKSGGNRSTPNRGPRTISRLPVEPGITVQLHQKPAFVLAQEKRKGKSIRKRLFQNVETEQDTTGGAHRKSGVVRLMRIQRSSTDEPFLSSLTSISRPRLPGIEGERQHKAQRRPAVKRRLQDGDVPRVAPDPFLGGPRRMKRLWIPISTIAPYAMLMNPRQSFHPSTGTFTTDAGLMTYRRFGFAKEEALPQSVDDIFTRTRRHKLDFSGASDPRSSKFFLDNDAIARWELQNAGLFDKRSHDLLYINQTVNGSFDAAPVDGDIRFDFDEPPAPVAPAPERILTRQRLRRLSPLLQKPETPFSPVWQERHRRPAGSAVPQHRRLSRLNESVTAEELDGVQGHTSAARPIIRRNRFIRSMPDVLVRKITTAVVVVRTLAGGVEGKMIDWNLVASAFPDYDPQFIQDRGKTIVGKSRLQMAKMQSDFQDRFVEAYENDEVPPIEYGNLEAYDWEWVVNWADTHLDVPTSPKLPDLPATREQFDSLFEIREEPPTSIDEVYQHNASLTIGRKRTLFAGVPLAIPLEDRPFGVTQRKIELSRLETAKTWVRANIITPEESYRPADARRSLERFGEQLVSNAVQSLVTERAISMGNRGRITPGRNYDITDHFLLALGRKRPVDSTQLKQAARFKTAVLDEELEASGFHEVKYNAEDGDVLAIINLAAEGKVVLRPSNPPKDKYGLTDGGYLTRLIDKDKLRFSIEVHPVPGTYVYGNPIKEKISTAPPPRGDMDVGAIVTADPSAMQPAPAALPIPQPFPGKAPIWFDVHRNFVKLMWDLVVAAVVGSVAIRPGISAAAIASMVKPTMGAWEVELLLEWLERVGVVQRGRETERDPLKPLEEEPGWVVREWWWLVVG